MEMNASTPNSSKLAHILLQLRDINGETNDLAQDIDGQQVTTSPSSPMPAYTTDDYTIPHYSYAARNASPGIRRAKEGGKQRDLQL